MGQSVYVNRWLLRLGTHGVAWSLGGWWWRRFAAGFVALCLAGTLAGCGDTAPNVSIGTNPGDRTAAPVYQADALVLESPEHGPQLCREVASSYPPQCGGPDVLGWNWGAVEGEESASGTTWGSYRVVGT
jgi:hypothetical protein